MAEDELLFTLTLVWVLCEFRVGRSWHTYIINSNLDIIKRDVLLFYLMGTWL